MAFKVLASDTLAASAVAAMRDAGLTVDEKTDLTPEQLKTEIASYDAIVIRSATKLRAEILEGASNLKLIVRAGVGLDNIDVEYAESHGLVVRNTPAASSNSVAELALAHIFSLARHIGRGTVSMKSGKWEKKALKGIEIAGKTLGIVGIGRIGQSLATKATALGMKVIAYDAYVSDSPLPDTVQMVSFDQLLARSDFISLHIPFDPKVGATIGAPEIAKMKSGVRIVNCARGGTVDEDALVAALSSGQVGGAALDVFATEPPSPEHAIFSAENVSFTPHVGASTTEASARVGKEAAQMVVEFARAQG